MNAKSKSNLELNANTIVTLRIDSVNKEEVKGDPIIITGFGTNIVDAILPLCNLAPFNLFDGSILSDYDIIDMVKSLRDAKYFEYKGEKFSFTMRSTNC